MRKLLKLVHNPTVAILLGLVFALAVHLAFAFGAYGAGLAISDNILQSLPGANIHIAPIMAFLYSVLLFGASMWAFIYKNHTCKDVKAYDIANKQQDSWLSTKNKFEVLVWLVGALELSSLMFRLSLMPPSVGRTWLGVFGIVAWFCAYLLGDILHAVIHRPIETELERSLDYSDRSIIEDSIKYLPYGTNEQRQRWSTSKDPSVLDEIKESVNGRKRTIANQKIQKQEAKDKKKRQEVEHFDGLTAIKNKFFSRSLDPVDFLDAQTTNPQTDRLSQQNGRQK